MRNKLYYTTLILILASCDSQKNITYSRPASQNNHQNQKNTHQKKAIESKVIDNRKLDFYYENIADASKNNNTISYGSIVSANPKNYIINKIFFPAVGQNFRQKFIIVHYTALDNEKSITTLTNRDVSAHYLVNDLPDNEIYQIVDENKRAYHAGISHWKYYNQLNDISIGIEIVNKGYVMDSLNQKQFFPFPDFQFRKIASLIKDISERYMIAPQYILGHSDIAPQRKQDPGPFFPWKRLYDEYHLGMWYDESVKQNLEKTAADDIEFNYNAPYFTKKVQQAFQDFGYDIQVTGIWDKQTQKVIEAFQYHFRPAIYNGIFDAETWAILQALKMKYK